MSAIGLVVPWLSHGDVKHGSRAARVLHGADAANLTATGQHRLACLIGRFLLCCASSLCIPMVARSHG